MHALNEGLLWLDGLLGGAGWFPYVLLGTGLFFTIYLGFPQVRFFGRALRIVRGKEDKHLMPGETSHFQALTTALSGTVGTGNIGGVAFAIFLGGPAALFWMWATAFLGMTTKFVEVTLSHKYRQQASDGSMAGGPMYFMRYGLNMKWLAAAFAVATVISSFGTGNLPQINNIASAMESAFGIRPMITGGVLAVLLALVILGGIKRIAAFTSKVVPLMAVLYLIGALGVLAMHPDRLIPSFLAVFENAFTGSAAMGGFLGASFAFAFNRGVNRGLFSNEAGQGSAPIAHASARANEPVSEGMVAILEPFIDTIVICTLTGIVILSSGVWTEKFENKFESADLRIVAGAWSDQNESDRASLGAFLGGDNAGAVKPYTGELLVADGGLVVDTATVLHARSVAEDVHWTDANGEPFSGAVMVSDGRLDDLSIGLHGRSLLHSAALTSEAFSRGYFGEAGRTIVAIGLLLFAFSTAIAWSYYGDRAMVYLFGTGSVRYYRIVYVLGFFWASFSDTRLVWNLAAVAIVIMTLPNLLGILLLRKDMKQSLRDYIANEVKK
ncbi:alanine/glycine:cation symporter family protein [Synoicihabitans lomoniglobus]|uniref:Amino acid carrier protein n=1 Tax=Synoicihabitans lomoniglobus TaxID=2909285 RepID=A0AAE9ZXG8_9BACT|nr:amino acid carrier protein [Opitutaceae bacterium LMO-M01]WED65306.1 amino acid carrier protein [Opitutaceae bacterium LMO-M01]